MHRCLLAPPASASATTMWLTRRLPPAHAYLTHSHSHTAAASYLTCRNHHSLLHSAASSSSSLSCPLMPIRLYSTVRIRKSSPPSGHGRNTQGSNAYRKKRAGERARRGGLDAELSDMPIQSVSDPTAQQFEQRSPTAASPLPASSPSTGIDSRFPSFGKNYKPQQAVPLPPPRPSLKQLVSEEVKQARKKFAEVLKQSDDSSELSSSSSSSSKVNRAGGAHGRADAYRVPGERFGGSYKKLTRYEPEHVIERRKQDLEQKEDLTEEDIARMWEEQDRKMERLASSSRIPNERSDRSFKKVQRYEPEPVITRPAEKKVPKQEVQQLSKEELRKKWEEQDREMERLQEAALSSSSSPKKSIPEPEHVLLKAQEQASKSDNRLNEEQLRRLWEEQDRETERMQRKERNRIAPHPPTAAELKQSPPPPITPLPIKTARPVSPDEVAVIDLGLFENPPSTIWSEAAAAKQTTSEAKAPEAKQVDIPISPLPDQPVSSLPSFDDDPFSSPSSSLFSSRRESKKFDRKQRNDDDELDTPDRFSRDSKFARNQPFKSRDTIEDDDEMSYQRFSPRDRSIGGGRERFGLRPNVPDTEDSPPLNAPAPPSTLQAPVQSIDIDEDGPHASTSTSTPTPPHLHTASSPTPPSTLRTSSSAPPPSAALCCGCGAAFQSSYLDSPGFLPEDQLEKYIGRRMKLFEGRVEAERKKRELAEARERERRVKEEKTKKGKFVKKPTLEVSDTVDIVASESNIDPVEPAESKEQESTNSATSSSTTTAVPSPTLHPDLYTIGRLSPDRPLHEQDLTHALNAGLISADDPDALLALGIPPEMIMSKRDLNAFEREKKEQQREVEGEAAIRCLRCFQLQNYGYTRGQVTSVRADDFRVLLKSRFMERGGKSCVILKVVDLFDFHGSFIQDFSSIVGGRNPIILVANKYDLLPDDAGENRIRAWIKAESARYGLHFHSIELVSALTGHGLSQLMQTATKLAEPDLLRDRGRRDIYIVGTTNVGKSSIVNQLIEKKIITSKGQFEATKISEVVRKEEGLRTNGANENKPLYLSASSFLPSATTASESVISAVRAEPDLLASTLNTKGGKMTASIVPGTTLGMVSFPFVPKYDHETGLRKDPIQHVLYDTPGVINQEQLSNHLTYHELRAVMPRRRIQPLTYRITRGQCLIIGGLGRIDFVEGERDYCFFTVFATRNVTVHISKAERMDTVQVKKEKKEKLGQGSEEGEKSDNEASIATATTSDSTAATTSSSSASPTTSTSATAVPEEPLEIGYLELIKKHGGTRIYPPFTPERCREIGLHTGTRMLFDLHGRGWLEACEDIVFPGLGWVSITGSGTMTVRAILPGKIKAYAREPLMPFESRKNMKKFTGSAIRQH